MYPPPTAMLKSAGSGRDPLANKVLVDYNKLGWADDNKSKIGSDYEVVLHVGKDGNPEQDSPDDKILSFCLDRCCDLLTGDKRIHTSLLRDRPNMTVQISQFALDAKSGQPVYLIKFL